MSDVDEPARHRLRLEPDIPLDFSKIPAVQELIKENNCQTRPKRRLKMSDFICEVFTRLGTRAASGQLAVDVLLEFLHECTEKHKTAPRTSAIAKVLYFWLDKGMVEEGQKLLIQLLQAQPLLRDKVIDEKVATVSLRIISRSTDADLNLMEKILQMLPEGSFRRRVFSPMLEHAVRTGNTAFAFKTLRLGREKKIEFWDADYSQMLSCLMAKSADCSTKQLLGELLESMEDHHPVVGRSNAEALRHLMGGEMTHVDAKTGKCCRCGARLQTFDFSPSDRSALLKEIETKLIAPRVDGASHYEPEKRVTPAEKERRWQEFEAFKQKLFDSKYDAVIDGANVGYYGLNSWYREAKESLLRASGVDPATVPAYQLNDIPLPVDVPPKFSLIEEMLTQARCFVKKPVVMLHNRHIENPSKENFTWLRRWNVDSSVIACPGFLNDDYCWLYAAISRPGCLFISNDQMRDHHFMLLSRRSFLRWRQRHRVTYKALFQRVGNAVNLVVKPPNSFAVWVQRGQLSSSHWHVPALLSVDVIEQATNRVSEKLNEIDKDGDDSCDAWLCTAENEFLNRNV